MANILDMQGGNEETPDEEKGSYWSLAACRNSYRSYVACLVK